MPRGRLTTFLSSKAVIPFTASLSRCGSCGFPLPKPDLVGGRQVMGYSEYDPGFKGQGRWNARKLGAKRALKPQQVRAIRFWLDSKRRVPDRAMFDLAIDSKLRGCDIVSGGRVRARTNVIQRKNGRRSVENAPAAYARPAAE